jgi:hypothetical protein
MIPDCVEGGGSSATRALLRNPPVAKKGSEADRGCLRIPSNALTNLELVWQEDDIFLLHDISHFSMFRSSTDSWMRTRYL